MKATKRVMGTALLGVVCLTIPAALNAQVETFEKTTETNWGASVYGGGQVDSLGNLALGLRLSYKVFELDPLVRLSPEIGFESRKNFLLAKAGARGDSRELYRLSVFGGAGMFRIQDFTNSGGPGDTTPRSDETWYVYYGAKFRMPSLAGVPILGGIIGGLPLTGASLFVAQELNGLEPPSSPGEINEFTITEWFDNSVLFGVMIGSASGWHTQE
jgi:hypothetical protein